MQDGPGGGGWTRPTALVLSSSKASDLGFRGDSVGIPA